MNVSELMADCDFIMMTSSHIYNGSRSDCRKLSELFGRTVVSCRSFETKSVWLSSLISIVEATADNDIQIVVISSDGVPVFRYWKRSRFSVPDKYEFLDDNEDWQADIHLLASSAERGEL